MWIENLPDGRFKYRERYVDPYTEKERKVSTILTSNSNQAAKKAQILLNQKIAKKLEIKESRKITFYEVVDEWYSSHKKTIRDGSVRAYNAHIKVLKNYINKNILIKNIDRKFLQRIFNDLNYSNQYMMSLKSILKQIFLYAFKMEYIDVNPMEYVEIIKRAKTKEELELIQNKYLEKEEAEKLIHELYRRPSTYRGGRLAEFMYLTGVRIGEAVALKQEDFDFKNKTVFIHGTIDIGKSFKKAVIGPTKTLKGTRTISLTDRAIKLVQRSIEENKLDSLSSDKYYNQGFIFTTKTGLPMQTNSFNFSLKGAGDRIGLTDKKLSSHIFRHSHVSLLAEFQIPLPAIMERVGHEDSDTTNKIYTHVTKNMKSNIISQLEERGL